MTDLSQLSLITHLTFTCTNEVNLGVWGIKPTKATGRVYICLGLSNLITAAA